MYKTKDDKILCILAITKMASILKQNGILWHHTGKSHVITPWGIIKISKSRASHQHPMQDKILTINSLHQWPQSNFQLNVPIQWLELSQNMLLSCTEKEKSSVSFCFKESRHNPLEEISNFKNALLYCNSFSFSCSYSAPFKLFCLQFPILHFSPSDISYKYNCATATSGWYEDFPVHQLIWNQITHISASWSAAHGIWLSF
jgi:hypothetical protein